MSTNLTFLLNILFIINNALDQVNSKGLLLLYRPKDITQECVMSKFLRFDISYGMGMSDTITLVMRTESKNDYRCAVEVVSEPGVYIIVVINYPNTMIANCKNNPNAFIIVLDGKCMYICDYKSTVQYYSRYYTVSFQDRVFFLFSSNSSINSDMNVVHYQITMTSARKLNNSQKCLSRNETVCGIHESRYCFTNGVVCDGIKNCGISDWYDERKADCGLIAQKVGVAPVITVLAAISCAVLAIGHAVIKWLPPVAKSFFIFNANEDNRFCVQPLFTCPSNFTREKTKTRRYSIIPIGSSNSNSGDESDNDKEIDLEDALKELSMGGDVIHTKASKDVSSKQHGRRPTALQKIRRSIRAATQFRRKTKTNENDDVKKTEII